MGLLRSVVPLAALATIVALAWTREDGPSADRLVDFDREIRPILSENCFACHGPDEQARKGKLRLDTREGALARAQVLIPGDPDASTLLERVAHADNDKRMPPPKTGKRLTSAQVDRLRTWIRQGAPWSVHWAFVPPKRGPWPEVRASSWPRNPIDHFILARLEKEQMQPSPEADPVTLLRRVTLDLTGLPPTPAEVDAFLADRAPGAYERAVDRLLDSPRYGERMALEWLDAARFADTHGYHIDSGRDMTLWREWVIEAFNRNQPFDQFTIEQFAGDLLPGATLSQKVASGFHRNHMINFEGGAIPEEYHTAYIVDRVNTTATVWLGLTLACAQCHDHKYDPFSQKDYYRLFAFFHNVPENGLDGSRGNAAPLLRVPSREQSGRQEGLRQAIQEAEARVKADNVTWDQAQARWEKSPLAQRSSPVWHVVDPSKSQSRGGAEFVTRTNDRAILVRGPNPTSDTYTLTVQSSLRGITGLRIEALPDDSLTARGPGRSSNGNVVLTDVRILSKGKPVPLASSTADYSQKDYPISAAHDGNPTTGWALYPEVGRPHWAIFQFQSPLQEEGETELRIVLDFRSPFGQHQLGCFRLSLTTAPDPHGGQTLPGMVSKILALTPEQRTESQKRELRDYYRSQVAPEGRTLHTRLAELRQKLAELEKSMTTTMVMQEMGQPRDTFLLIRGQYDKKGEKVLAGTPAALAPLPKGAPSNRLGLAQWLVDPQQPLTPRVFVNRLWQMDFGVGLVKTSEDFGTQGERPSHPELLDWLAAKFVESGWDVKALRRLLVTSATYRQSSRVTPELLHKDPENRLLARMSRLRLPAEFLRDQALAVSGLLNGEIGGKSVSPYQPTGLWEELAFRADFRNWTAQTYVQDHGKDLYRRGMYTFWKRTVPPPTLVTFDAPDRETCTVRRARTNTPLQALILMNDPTYVEAARKFAERILREGGATIESRLDHGFRLAVARRPLARETAALRAVYEGQRAQFQRNPKEAQRLLAVGEAAVDSAFDPVELAAWSMVGSVLLNLDETLTRG